MWSMLWMPLAAAPADPVPDARSPSADEAADEALVTAFKGGDVRTFDALFGRYSQPIFGYIYRSVGDPALAEELTQEVFLKAFLHLRRTATETTFKAWIYRIATTTCIDAHRAAARRPVPVRDEEALALMADRAAGPLPAGADPAAIAGPLLRGDRRGAGDQRGGRHVADPSCPAGLPRRL